MLQNSVSKSGGNKIKSYDTTEKSGKNYIENEKVYIEK